MTDSNLPKVVADFCNLFPDSAVPDAFSHEGQTFDQRCEGWLLHAIEQIEVELQEFTECGRDPRQSPGECPQCKD